MATQDDLRIVARLIDETSATLRKIQGGYKQTERVGTKTADAISQQWKRMGRTVATTLGAFLGLRQVERALREGVRGSISFGTAMSEVSTIVDTSVVSMKQLADETQRIALLFGQDQAEVARGLYQAISSGAEAGAEALNTLRVSTGLAVAGVTTTATAVDALTSATNAYRATNLSTERAADVLFKTVEKGKTTMSELSGSIGRVLPVSSSLGVSIEETAAALATLTLSGLSTEEAATSLRQTLVSMLEVTSEGQELLEGTSVQFDAASVAANGLKGTLQAVQREFGGNSEALSTLFPNVRALTGVMSVLSDGGAKLDEVLQDITNSAGAYETALLKRINDPSFKAQQAVNALKIGLSDLGTELVSAFVGSLDSLGETNDRLQAIRESALLLEPVVFGLVQGVFSLVHAFASMRLAALDFGVTMAELGNTVGAVSDEELQAFQVKLAEVEKQSKELSESLRAARDRLGRGLGAAAAAGDIDALTESVQRQIDALHRLSTSDEFTRQVNQWQRAFSEGSISAEAFNSATRTLTNTVTETAEELLNELNTSALAIKRLREAGTGFQDPLVEGAVDAIERLRDLGIVTEDISTDELRREFEASGGTLDALAARVDAAREELRKLLETVQQTGNVTISGAQVDEFAISQEDAIELVRELNLQLGEGSIALPEYQKQLDNINARVAAFEIAKLVEQFETGKISLQELEEAQRSLGRVWREGELLDPDALKDALRATEDASRAVGRTVADLALNYDSATESVDRFVESLLKQAIAFQAQQALAGAFGGIPGFAGFAQFLGFRSHGGVHVGRAEPLKASHGAVVPRVQRAARGFVPQAPGPQFLQVQEGPFSREAVLPLAETTMKGERVLGVAAEGGGGGKMELTVFINAVDAPSFLQLAAHDPAGLAQVVLAGVDQSPAVKSQFGIRGSLR